ncbi:1-aminocyclopropane-1-carboxylate oxidase homolog 1-like [Cucurbita maxima]|uniref:1-aminocyclopropane-1-carboxylate oxidase homolog 1-like n=1 Tax=Cucurbita maxima TaxID=3661 RepID=A0A6J1KRK1_CUCMA|nr:1-aminocyclopropane-1-carboxylate oxidase homolog 1-like [Cucurbita maxima]
MDPSGDDDSQRARQVKEFDDTKSGVKGLMDRGATTIPKFFIHPSESANRKVAVAEVPVIDLREGRGREEVVREIGEACEKWGLFQMVNHGVPNEVMERMLEGIREFHEQAREEKMKWYSRDPSQKVRFYCNGDLLVSKAASWRDSIAFEYQHGPLTPQAYPPTCREAVSEYIKQMTELRDKISELLSEALGLSSDYLAGLECMKSETLVCHYYPPCPQPELTLGTTKHSDPSALTILLQDNTGGLQVLHQNQWLHVPPIPGALLANIGDLLQLITNDKIKSVEHRVLARSNGKRVSAACFFYPSAKHRLTPYGPAKEFQSEDNPPIYRPTNINEYLSYYILKGLDGSSALPYFRI